MSDCYIVRRGGMVESSLSFPEFTYTGNYSLIDDGLAADGKTQNWRIKFLTSGVLTFSKLGSGEKGIDIFCVGGGGGGSYVVDGSGQGSGGGGGYTKTAKNVVVQLNTENSIVVGAGGIGSNDWQNRTGGNGGKTSAFNISADGGVGGSAYNAGGKGGSGGGGRGGKGGSNGSAGGGAGGDGQNTTTCEFAETSGALYAGGGGGAGAAGGDGGGGDGGTQQNGVDGTTNLGGGGGGSNSTAGKGGDGGAGIVIIRNARYTT